MRRPTFLASREFRRSFINFINTEETLKGLPLEAKRYFVDSVFEAYAPNFLHLFLPQNLSHHEHYKTLWNELISTPSGKNYWIPIPDLYFQARRAILHPFALSLEHQIIRPIQAKIVTYPKASLTASSILIALNSSILSISLGLFTGLSVIFNTPKQHGDISKNLWGIGQNIALYSLMGSILFPLILKGFIDNNFELPISELFTLGSALLCNFFIEFKTALNSYNFEKRNSDQIAGRPKQFSKMMLKNTFSPFLNPSLGALAGCTLAFMPENILIQGALFSAKIISVLNSGHLAIKLFQRKGSPEDAIQLILTSFFSLIPYALRRSTALSSSPSDCLEIEEASFFGIDTLVLPKTPWSIVTMTTMPIIPTMTQRYCHETSGFTWNARPLGSSISKSFTAESLAYGYEIFSTPIEIKSPESALFAWLDPSKTSDPIQNFCQFISQEHCLGSTTTNQLKVLSPSLEITTSAQGRAFSLPFRSRLITRTDTIEKSQEAMATLFLGIRAYRLYKTPSAT